MIRLTAILFFSLCASTFASERSLVVQGQIIQDKTSSHSYNEDFAITPRSEAIITLEKCTDMEDHRKCVRRIKKTIKVTSLPISFKIMSKDPEFTCGGRDADGTPYACFLDVVVRSKGGKKTRVGDLISEYVERIEATPAMDYTIRTFGLESCDTPNAGGFCL